MIPIEIARTISLALHFKLDFENRQVNLEFTDANSLANKVMAKQYAKKKQETEQALAWLQSQELQPQPNMQPTERDA